MDSPQGPSPGEEYEYHPYVSPPAHFYGDFGGYTSPNYNTPQDFRRGAFAPENYDVPPDAYESPMFCRQAKANSPKPVAPTEDAPAKQGTATEEKAEEAFMSGQAFSDILDASEKAQNEDAVQKRSSKKRKQTDGVEPDAKRRRSMLPPPTAVSLPGRASRRQSFLPPPSAVAKSKADRRQSFLPKPVVYEDSDLSTTRTGLTQRRSRIKPIASLAAPTVPERPARAPLVCMDANLPGSKPIAKRTVTEAQRKAAQRVIEYKQKIGEKENVVAPPPRLRMERRAA